MKKTIAAFVLFAAALIAAGCAHSDDKVAETSGQKAELEVRPDGTIVTGDPELDKIIAGLHAEEKAPVLGRLSVLFLLRCCRGDSDAAWEMVCAENQAMFNEVHKKTIRTMSVVPREQIDAQIASLEKQLADTTDTDQKNALEMQLYLMECAKDDFKALPDGKALFIYSMSKTLTREKLIQELSRTTFVGEKINEGMGRGEIMLVKDGKEDRTQFVRQNGEWKVVFNDYSGDDSHNKER